jgi:hypothetical protein
VAAFKARSAEFETGHAAMGAAQDRIQAAFNASPFDLQGLRRALDGVRQAREALDAAMFSATVEAAAAMTPESRTKLWNHGLGPPPPPRRWGGSGPQ